MKLRNYVYILFIFTQALAIPIKVLLPSQTSDETIAPNDFQQNYNYLNTPTSNDYFKKYIYLMLPSDYKNLLDHKLYIKRSLDSIAGGHIIRK
ncbi:uncharacterized protein LOC119683400 isoform X2 [Teleopsis dalmanni]|uniref:uncharacterized protein LOC119683400 isoform X2 n=1 Tax=Teleopsis dalmanni TaxID=139649 RepID=UPI0018CDF2B0|nr:uncharacterized protein LOC119683400 isoform X2 [Teleopsis dalmanni]